MSRRYGKDRCPVCHAWYVPDDGHTCPSSASVRRAAFPGHALEMPLQITRLLDEKEAIRIRARLAGGFAALQPAERDRFECVGLDLGEALTDYYLFATQPVQTKAA